MAVFDHRSKAIILPYLEHLHRELEIPVLPVRLWAGDGCMLARVTRRSARLLDLRQGKSLYAQVKSIVVVNRSPAVPAMV